MLTYYYNDKIITATPNDKRPIDSTEHFSFDPTRELLFSISKTLEQFQGAHKSTESQSEASLMLALQTIIDGLS